MLKLTSAARVASFACSSCFLTSWLNASVQSRWLHQIDSHLLLQLFHPFLQLDPLVRPRTLTLHIHVAQPVHQALHSGTFRLDLSKIVLQPVLSALITVSRRNSEPSLRPHLPLFLLRSQSRSFIPEPVCLALFGSSLLKSLQISRVCSTTRTCLFSLLACVIEAWTCRSCVSRLCDSTFCSELASNRVLYCSV